MRLPHRLQWLTGYIMPSFRLPRLRLGQLLLRDEIMNIKQIISLLLLVVLVIPLTNVIAQQQKADIVSVQQQAMIDAKRDAKNADTAVWTFAGFFCGIFGMMGAYAVTPSVPTVRLIGKSPEYVSFYADTYKHEARNEQVKAATCGCLGGVIASFAYWYWIHPVISESATSYY